MRSLPLIPAPDRVGGKLQRESRPRHAKFEWAHWVPAFAGTSGNSVFAQADDEFWRRLSNRQAAAPGVGASTGGNTGTSRRRSRRVGIAR